jgi:hypothetical protein
LNTQHVQQQQQQRQGLAYLIVRVKLPAWHLSRIYQNYGAV